MPRRKKVVGSPRAFAYIRCSHRHSVVSGAGLAAQQEAIARMHAEQAEILGIDLPWHTESVASDQPGHYRDLEVSAFKIPLTRRPAAAAMLAELRAGDHVFVAKLDRMFRSLRDMVEMTNHLSKQGVVLHFGDVIADTSTPIGFLTLSVMATFAEWQSRLHSQRKKEAYAIRRATTPSSPMVGRTTNSTAKTEKHAPTVIKGDPDIVATLISRRSATPVKSSAPATGRVFTYVRCSHLDSVETGNGLAWQRKVTATRRDKILKDHPGMTDGGVFEDDAVSAYKHRFARRPQGGKLDEILQAGDHVIFACLDRAFRSVRDMAETLPKWQDRGVTIHFVREGLNGDNPQTRAAIAVLTAFAELEPAIVSARTKEGLEALWAEGRGIARVAGFHWHIDKRTGEKSLVLNREVVACMRLSCFYVNTLGWTERKAAARVEALMAKRDGRLPIPESGVSACLAKKYCGKRPISEFRDGKSCKTYSLLSPWWGRRAVQHAKERLPLILEYVQKKRQQRSQRTVNG